MKQGEKPRDTVELASALVGIESFEHEQKAALFTADYLREAGFDVHLDEVKPQRPNVIAQIENNSQGPALMYCGHLDTVPPADAGQLEPRLDGGKLFGRGSADMKGGVAAMLSALCYLAEHRTEWSGKLMFLGTMGEETGLQGMSHFVRKRINEHRVDACIVGEPTAMNIGVAHKGMAWLRLATKGKEAHGSKPEQGVNAIYHMSLIVQALEESLKDRLQQRTHPMLGSPSVNVAIVQGGTRANVVPKACAIEIDRRVLPGEEIEAVLEEIRAVIDPLRRKHPLLDYELKVKNYNGPFAMDSTAGIVRTVSDAACFCSGKRPAVVGLSYGTDASEIAAVDVPAVVYGPGLPEQAHTKGEYIDIAELKLAAQVYRQIALLFCPKQDAGE